MKDPGGGGNSKKSLDPGGSGYHIQTDPGGGGHLLVE